MSADPSPASGGFGSAGALALSLLAVLLLVTISVWGGKWSHASSVSKRAAEKAIRTSSSPGVRPAEEPLPTKLSDLLKGEVGMVRPMAWARPYSPADSLSIAGVTGDDKLVVVRATWIGDSYSLGAPQPVYLMDESGQYPMIRESGDLKLDAYLTERDFPFKSDIVKQDKCIVHFLLDWQATNRSLEANPSPLGLINLRVIVETNGSVLRNYVQEFGALGVNVVFTEDLTGLGQSDYGIIDVEGNSRAIRIWSILDDCSVKPLDFIEDGQRDDETPGRAIFVNREGGSAGATIHRQMSEPVVNKPGVSWRVTDDQFRWDRKADAFVVTRTTHFLQ